MMQSRTHTCGALRLEDAGKNVNKFYEVPYTGD